MMRRITTDLIDEIKPLALDLVTGFARGLAHLRYADLRIEVIEAKAAGAENGASKFSMEDYAFNAGVRVLAGERLVAPGYLGRSLGAADLEQLESILKEALLRAYRRAMANGEWKADAREKFGALGESLYSSHLAPVRVCQDVVSAVYEIDPRSVDLAEMVRYATEISKEVAGLHAQLKYNYVSTLTQLSRELFCSSEGASIDQAFALTQGMADVVAVSEATSQELYDVLGHQRGWEILLRGVREDAMAFPPFRDFALELAREAVALANAPALPTSDREVVVVTDPHYNTLVSHEIIGHPTELDRVLKMETAYAGRSWFFQDLTRHQIDQQVASPLVTAFSDPGLPGYGHYRYDDEGTPARRVIHIDRGIFRGFMNSRQTAAILGALPNGHYKATDASLVPLIRMSNTVFA
ncbi:MAG: TldD/PmbA family protein, partial [Candidatus Rokubacteria bacterium]|nr:TldD/PmbA family protein [Candidatus Rokubacteria bacterium]